MNKGDKVKWTDGVGFEHTGVVNSDTDPDEFMIPVLTNDDRILRIRYLDLTLIETRGTREYTKGEWKVIPNNDGSLEVIGEKNGFTPAVATINPRNKEANARLIAAAPNMYEALKGLNAYCEAYFHKDHSSHFWDLQEDIAKALAKAEVDDEY